MVGFFSTGFINYQLFIISDSGIHFGSNQSIYIRDFYLILIYKQFEHTAYIAIQYIPQTKRTVV